MKGVEPSCPAWEAGVLPMNYTRILICIDNTILSALFPVLAKSYLGKRRFDRYQILLLKFDAQRGIGGENSELCKEGYNEAMYKNSCRSCLCD